MDVPGLLSRPWRNSRRAPVNQGMLPVQVRSAAFNALQKIQKR